MLKFNSLNNELLIASISSLLISLPSLLLIIYLLSKNYIKYMMETILVICTACLNNNLYIILSIEKREKRKEKERKERFSLHLSYSQKRKGRRKEYLCLIVLEYCTCLSALK